MEDTFSSLRKGYPALGAGMYNESELMEAPEEEDIDLMNNETFGDNIDPDFDWEEEHEKLAEGLDFGDQHREKGIDIKYGNGNYNTQEEFMEQSISQLVVDDEEMDDPAILNASKSKPIPLKAQNLDDIFGPSSPPALLDTEHLFAECLTCIHKQKVSPSSKNIWGSPVKESHMQPPPINNLQSLFDFAKAAAGTNHHPRVHSPIVGSMPNRSTSPIVKGKTLEELEQQMMPSTNPVSKVVTAEELERELRGERMDQRVPQMPPKDPLFNNFPPGYVPPHGSPASRQMPHIPQAQRIPPGYGQYPQSPHVNNGRRSPLANLHGTPPIGYIPPHLLDGRRTPPGVLPGSPSPHMYARGSPSVSGSRHVPGMPGVYPPNRTTPSPPPVAMSPQLSGSATNPARAMSPYAHGAVMNMMGNRMSTAPIGIPRNMVRGPHPQNQYNNSAPHHQSPHQHGSPYGPPPPPHGSPYGPPPHHSSPYGPPPPSHGSPYGPPHHHHYDSPGGPRPQHPMQNDSRYNRGRGERGRGQYRNYGGRGSYNNMDLRDKENRPNRRYYYFNEEEDRKRSVDAYAGLMTQKEKDWIIKIQLLQLQTENPYIDDYYYTTHTLKRKAAERQRRQEEGILDDKDTELSLIIPAMAKLEIRPYKPAQFEGSLGRLTTSSVHNPRQIIDVTSDGLPHGDDSETKSVSRELRKSRQLLMEIEKGYNLLLDVDDIEKKTLALPEEARTPLFEDRKNMLDDLFNYFLSSQNNDHFLWIMSVRKGKKLVARVLPLLQKNQAEEIVLVILKNLQHLIKKDPGEEGLMLLHDPVMRVVENCDLKALVAFSEELKKSGQHKSKAAAVAIQNKFGSSIMCSLLHRGEVLHINTSPLDIDNQLENTWCQFVHDFAGILAVVPTESLVHPKNHHSTITEHFDRLLNKKLIAVIEDKVKLFTEPERAA